MGAWLATRAIARAQSDNAAGSGHTEVDDGSPRVRMPRVPIPANGAILIESTSRPSPTVYTEAGVAIEGVITDVGWSGAASLFAWTPSAPLEPGRYIIRLPGFSIEMTDEITVIDAIDDVPPVVTTELSLSGLVETQRDTCCETPLHHVTGHCTADRLRHWVQLDAGLSSMESGVKLHQYLFAMRSALPRTALDVETFVPFNQLDSLTFRNIADSYCFTLDALNVATLQRHRYTELETCAERGELHIGGRDVAPPTEFFDINLCPVPEAKHEAAWCDANANVCTDRSTSDCELYRYVCEDGPLPPDWQQVANAGRVDTSDEPSSTCAVSMRGTRAPPRAAQALALALMLAAGLRTRSRSGA